VCSRLLFLFVDYSYPFPEYLMTQLRLSKYANRFTYDETVLSSDNFNQEKPDWAQILEGLEIRIKQITSYVHATPDSSLTAVLPYLRDLERVVFDLRYPGIRSQLTEVDQDVIYPLRRLVDRAWIRLEPWFVDSPWWKTAVPLEEYKQFLDLGNKLKRAILKASSNCPVELSTFSEPSSYRRTRWKLLYDVMNPRRIFLLRSPQCIPKMAPYQKSAIRQALIDVPCEPRGEPLPEHAVKILSEYISLLRRCIGLSEPKTAMQYLLTPLVIFGCLGVPDVSIRAGEYICGNQIPAYCRADLVLYQKDTMRCLINFHHERFDQGYGETLSTAELAAESRKLDVVHAVAADRNEWIFARSGDQDIQSFTAYLKLLQTESLSEITGYVHAIMLGH